ncbi:MAG TPA: M48 family metallopeptidase [Steroidobacteraceae bacterium]|nr:M48 family metallopeptidase [Steroidobacteraceae bacterium]
MIEGRFFDAHTSAARPASLEIGRDRMIRLVTPAGLRQVSLDEVAISDRVANVPRRIRFADGASFETPANDAVDAALAAAGHRSFAKTLNRWEGRWRIALGALVAVAAISWAFVKFGMPALANAAARLLPPSVDETIGAEGLELLDGALFQPSKLPPARQEGLRRRLAAMAAAARDGHRYRLEFRRGGRIVGPNAFALPSGIIVVTDELVMLAHSDAEIDAVLAHEVGHVRQRHALRILLQDAGVAALALAVLGDVGTASSMVAAVPVLLVQAKHSRDFEREADAYSRAWLAAQGAPVSAFDTMLCRMQKSDSDVPYLSTHPPIEERASCGK